ncbi:MAG: phospholipase D-like domain-containing protein [Aquirufa antheringensis]|nr:phospholipase D-like domain-containing protein [Aquirufa antheringensis]
MENVDLLNQKTLTNGEEIFDTIKGFITNAEEEVLIAVAWITDREIYNLLLDKLKEGVRVELLVNSDKTNEDLDLDIINTYPNGYFSKIKMGSNFGTFHPKFCVIDSQYVVFGSSNFSVSARKHNQEMVVIGTTQENAKQYIDAFNQFKDSNGKLCNNSNERNEVIERKKVINEYERLLEELIESEVKNFDRLGCVQDGYERSKSSLGDFNILHHSLDSIYYKFVKDVELLDNDKIRVIAKINEARLSNIKTRNLEYNLKAGGINAEFQNLKDFNAIEIQKHQAEIEKNETKIATIKNTEIKSKKDEIEKSKSKITEKKLEFIQPKYKLFELIPSLIINFSLLVYLFLFYSSAGYILTFLENDMKIADANGVQLNVGVFNPNAIPNALNHGFWGLLMILVSFILPTSFAISNTFVKNKIVSGILTYGVGLFAIDFFISLKVSQILWQADILSNKRDLNDHWSWNALLSDSNFYLTFVLGALALIIFKFTYKHLIEQFAEKNPSIMVQRNNVEIDLIKEDIKSLENEIVSLELSISELNTSNLTLKQKIQQGEYTLSNIESKKLFELEQLELAHNTTLQFIENVTAVVLNKIENNNTKLSISAFRDRCASFFEGWNNFLHEHYAQELAAEKSLKAQTIYHDYTKALIASNKFVSMEV